MADLRDVMVYLCEHYPHKNELSNARLTKMVYLADWACALRQGRQMTGIEWEFYHYGPYVEDVVRTARESADLTVTRTANWLGARKELISVAGTCSTELGEEDRGLLDFVIERTKDLHWDEFMRLVYSTHPVASQARYSHLDLVQLAKEYTGQRGTGTQADR